VNKEPIPYEGALPLVVVLVAPRNPLNIGAVARAMSNFGFGDLRLVDAYDVAFQEAKSAVNAEWVLREARSFPSLAEAIADCVFVVGASGVADRDLTTPVHRLERGAERLCASAANGRVALVFGSEKYGLSREDISFCHELVHIPTRPAHDSMNLGQAVAVCLYELIREKTNQLPSEASPRTAPAATLDRLHRYLFHLLRSSGYVNPTVGASAEEKLRQFIRRLRLSAKDATLMLGMVRQLQLALDDESIRESIRAEWRKSGEN
jgi:TrmH family RNA methyltransferase